MQRIIANDVYHFPRIILCHCRRGDGSTQNSWAGYLEAVYQAALAHEMKLRGIDFEREKHLPVTYKGTSVGHYIADFVVADKIILELKAVAKMTKAHKAQTINYLITTGFRLGILINFGESSLVYRRILNKINWG